MKTIKFGELKNGDKFKLIIDSEFPHWYETWPLMKNTFENGNCCTITPIYYYCSVIMTIEDDKFVEVVDL